MSEFLIYGLVFQGCFYGDRCYERTGEGGSFIIDGMDIGIRNYEYECGWMNCKLFV